MANRQQSRIKQKIIYVITKSNWGGAGKYVYELATSLPKDKFDVLVVLGGNGELSKKLRQKGIRVIGLKRLERDISILNEYRVFKNLIHIFKRESPDIIHLNSSKIGGLGALAGRLAHVPKIVFTAHGWYFKEERNVLWILITKFLSWLTIILSHKVVTVSHEDETRVRNFPFILSKVSTIQIGAKKPEFLAPEIARQRLAEYMHQPISFLQNKDVIITIAELTKNKGIVYAISAMRRLKNSIYLIIGNGEDEEMLQHEISKYDLNNQIFLLGPIDNAATLLSGADIFLLPSIKEGLPYVLLEAGFARLPVVAASTGGIPEVIIHRKTGLLVPIKQSREIARSIEALLDSQSTQEHLGIALSNHVESKFTFDIMLNSTLSLYE
ncbi:hypothetical protein COB55_02345, partial [Candidatus Wolfebacteria bacterium]